MPSSETQSSWLLLQLADSGFPTGGFAHSAGLEAAVQHGAVRDAEALRCFAIDSLEQQTVSMLPLVLAAHAGELPLASIEEEADVFLSQRVPNRASRTQGRAFLETCLRVFPAELEEMAAGRGQARFASPSPRLLHHAPIFGAVLRALGVARDDTAELFLSGFLRALLSAGVRLGVLGPLESQRLQHALHPELSAARAKARAWDGRSPLVQLMPRWELLGATHDRLYTRLFQS